MFEKIFAKFRETANTKLANLDQHINRVIPATYSGRIKSATGSIITAILPHAKIGDLCLIEDNDIGLSLYAEVIMIHLDEVKLQPFGRIDNISSLALVRKVSESFEIKVGNFVLGKIIDGLGNVIGCMDSDDSIEISSTGPTKYYSVMNSAPDPLSRKIVDTPLFTGVKAIDLFITCGKGQRLAIFAGPGMGKTTLMGMIIRYAKADIIVVALIGERGREVREFIDLELDTESKKRCVLVVATSDRPPVEQVKTAYIAQTIAEYFRDQGLDVILFVDSITRFARAQREVGLSAGEPITRGGYPPSVFLSFPQLMERAGNGSRSSITAFYTVLMEGENVNQDPIADEIKSIVDGHIVLNRKLVESGHFPAISILASLSRVADRIIRENHKASARKIRMLLSKYEELEFLIRVGEYSPGNDEIADEAIEKNKVIMKFLQQGTHEIAGFEQELNKIIEMSGLD